MSTFAPRCPRCGIGLPVAASALRHRGFAVDRYAAACTAFACARRWQGRGCLRASIGLSPLVDRCAAIACIAIACPPDHRAAVTRTAITCAHRSLYCTALRLLALRSPPFTDRHAAFARTAIACA
ncbi:predicted protein [Streptomyces sp. AA4]|nr:predicted protein [Streptomyces sp. AA4]